MTDSDFEIVEGYRPGAIGAIGALHAAYYAREWGFGLFFEAKVASEAADFFARYDNALDRAWLVRRDGDILGTLVIDGSDPGAKGRGAHLRWFIMADACRGHGFGEALMRRAIDFVDRRHQGRCYLTTFAGLDAARALYERHGFRLVSEQEDRSWGEPVMEQLFERVTR